MCIIYEMHNQKMLNSVNDNWLISLIPGHSNALKWSEAASHRGQKPLRPPRRSPGTQRQRLTEPRLLNLQPTDYRMIFYLLGHRRPECYLILVGYSNQTSWPNRCRECHFIEIIRAHFVIMHDNNNILFYKFLIQIFYCLSNYEKVQ